MSNITYPRGFRRVAKGILLTMVNMSTKCLGLVFILLLSTSAMAFLGSWGHGKRDLWQKVDILA